MKDEVLNFVRENKVGVLAVQMPDDSPHAATVHFAHTDEPLTFFFETSRDYRKAESLLKNSVTKASFVIGSSESDMRTLQIDGEASLISDEEREKFDSVYFSVFPEKTERSKTDPKVIFFKLAPTWWRYTDWTKPEGKISFDSEGNLVQYDA